MKSQIRIIGGKWRGRKLQVIDAEGLRPTPDRIRETLFNWLAKDLRDATLLDCFAGSGALGFEALSRGARRVTAFERHPTALANLQLQAERFENPAFEIIAGDAVDLIGRLQRKYDIVFIDPPYAEPQLRERVLKQLESRDCLQTGAKIYFEWPASENFDLPSARLRWLKQKSAGQVKYAIAEWRGSR
ncbi:MAG: 16S rRNA (guanine(966)-N(2))-methyltransferase RsmD [Gammaproteobacteria bacterium]|nr:16S rRNA (guanine(966)-N(2))-methyltransferase RsmD [Gammaproteobacteria bacterium]MBT8436209.1 16S rRNA (guanine(966)-N(2))-methyltransferase RsmD [Gammaproteobacteria bacterium]